MTKVHYIINIKSLIVKNQLIQNIKISNFLPEQYMNYNQSNKINNET